MHHLMGRRESAIYLYNKVKSDLPSSGSVAPIDTPQSRRLISGGEPMAGLDGGKGGAEEVLEECDPGSSCGINTREELRHNRAGCWMEGMT